MYTPHMIRLADLKAHVAKKPRLYPPLPTYGQRLSASCGTTDEVPRGVLPLTFEQPPIERQLACHADPFAIARMPLAQEGGSGEYHVARPPRRGIVLAEKRDKNSLYPLTGMGIGGQVFKDAREPRTQVDSYNRHAFGPNAMLPMPPAGLAANARDTERGRQLPRLHVDAWLTWGQLEIVRLQRQVAVKERQIATYRSKQEQLGLTRARNKARLLAGPRRRGEFKACATQEQYIDLIVRYSDHIPAREKEIAALKVDIERLRKQQQQQQVAVEEQQQEEQQQQEVVAVPIMQQNFSKNEDSDYEPETSCSSEDDMEEVDERQLMMMPRGIPIEEDGYDLAEAKRNARKNNDGSHWADTGYGNGSGTFWAAETEINERPLQSLKPRELKQRALTAGAVQADIDKIERDPGRLRCICMEDKRYPKDCWLKHQLIGLIKRKKQLEQERQDRVQHNGKLLKELGIKQARLPKCTCKQRGACEVCKVEPCLPGVNYQDFLRRTSWRAAVAKKWREGKQIRL